MQHAYRLGPTASACVCDVLKAQLSLSFRERKSKGRKSRKESEGDRESLTWKSLPQRFTVRIKYKRVTPEIQ